MATHRSFTEQALHYAMRPESGRPDQPVDHPAAWYGPDLEAQPERWLVELTASQIDEVHASASSALDGGVDPAELTATTFPLPGLADDLAAWRRTLRDGSGALCLRGLPVREWGDELSALAYWGLGHHLGVPGAQNPQGELLGHVTNYREADGGLGRAYRTADDIAFHCDTADVVGLMCLRTAAEGGQSRIASSVTVFNELMRRRSDLTAELFTPWSIDRRGEEGPGEAPAVEIVPCAWDGTSLRTFWHSDYMTSATRHRSVTPLSEARAETLRIYNEIAGSEEVRFDMWLREGDIQLISNHSVVHSRTAYVDHEDPDEQRHLLRLWLSLEAS